MTSPHVVPEDPPTPTFLLAQTGWEDLRWTAFAPDRAQRILEPKVRPVSWMRAGCEPAPALGYLLMLGTRKTVRGGGKDFIAVVR